MRRSKVLAALVLAVLTVLAVSVQALGAETSVTYQDGKFTYGSQSGEQPLDLFENFKGAMPGDTLSQTITVVNGAKADAKIYLRSLGAAEGSEALLKELTLTVYRGDGTELYAGPADQAGSLSEWVLLADFAPGDKLELQLTLEVPITLGDEFQETAATVQWEFKAEEAENPDTGDTAQPVLWLAVGVGALTLALLLVVWKRRERS